jgi:hypothetical protein
MKNQIIAYIAFGVLAFLWLAFFAAMLINPELLNTAWQTFRGWPLIVQLVVGLLTLPVTLGLWIWNTAWPIWLRLILVIGLAGVTLYTFFPKKSARQPEISTAES